MATVLLVGSGVFLLARYEPTADSWYPKCMLHQWTGLHCPGCGATRACRAVVQGDLWSAVRYNPLLIVGGPLIAASLWWQRRRERRGGPYAPWLSWTICIVVIAFFILRNLPTPTTSWLAP